MGMAVRPGFCLDFLGTGDMGVKVTGNTECISCTSKTKFDIWALEYVIVWV